MDVAFTEKIVCLYLLVHSCLFSLCIGRNTKANWNRWVYETKMDSNEKSTFILNKIFIHGEFIFGILPHLYVCTQWAHFVNKFPMLHRLKYLTSKGPSCVFDNIKILGRYVWLEICIFKVKILIESRDKEYHSYRLNFMTFENMSQKLWLNP